TDGAAESGTLLRERETPLGEGPVTRELLKELGPRSVVYLERDHVLRLVGAELLLDAVAAAEVSAGDRQVTRDEALQHLLGDAMIGAALAPALGGDPSVEERVFALLRGKGGPIMSVAQVAAALSVGEAAVEPAIAALVARGRVLVQSGSQGQRLLVLMRGAV